MEKMTVGAILNHPNVMERISKFSQMSPQELAQWKVDRYNDEPGHLNEKDGYDCPICKNRGDIAEVQEWPAGTWVEKYVQCKCSSVRNSIRRMEQSGLGNVIRDKTFAKYEAPEPWQQTIKAAAMQYAKDASGWFGLFGQPGCGKSHLGAAICREFLLAGRSVAYMVWPDDSAAIKGAATDGERREELLDRFKKAKVLYIDDLFKPAKTPDKSKLPPTSADIKLAFEILNFRYNDPALLTIISSEFSTNDLLDIDEALGSRIIEKSQVFNIAEDVSRNYRLKKAVSL